MNPMGMESRVELVRGVPITLFTRSGRLRLAGNRLSFTRSRERVVLDVPVSELHSVATSFIGFTVWHGKRRYRFTTHEPQTVVQGPGIVGATVAAAQLPEALARYREEKQLAQAWRDVLAPLVGPTPDDVRVRAPWPGWAWILTIVAATLVLIAAFVGITLATA
jgi:hypothetical protein